MLSDEAILFYADEPTYFVEDIIRAKPDQKQRDILRSLRDYPMTSVRSGHGIGKSAVEAWSVIWFICTRPFPKIPCTAPTEHQLMDVLWAEISKWMRNNPALKDELIWTKEKLYMKGYPEEWFAVPRTATNPEALQGFHAEHVLYIIDEASGVSDKVFEPVLGAMTGEDAKLLMMGNPTRLTGFFYDSHHRNRAQYSAMHVDGRDSCHVSKKFVQQIIDMFGMDSDVFRVRVAGQFPKATPDSLIAMEWCESATKLQPDISRTRVDIGIDVARYGDDSSVLYPLVDKVHSPAYEVHNHNRTTEISGYAVMMIKQYAQQYPDAVIRVKVDCDGLGVGVYDNLYDQKDAVIDEIWADRCRAAGLNPNDGNQWDKCKDIPRVDLDIVECHFGAAGGKVDDEDPVEYSNSTGLMWGKIRKYLKDGRLQLPDDDTLFSQLSNRRYSVNKDGKIEMERKEAMKKRGLPSPDIADALALALYDPIEWSFNWG
ncbi:MAG: terminase [Enterocloster asparagiformis]|nr:terminase [Enterocloster asparagiformis]